MSALGIVADRMGLLVVYVMVFLVSYLSAEVFYRVRRDRAIAWGIRLDKGRKPLIRIIHRAMNKRYGILHAVVVIFLINLAGGALIWSTIGGILIVFPFLHSALIGFLVNLVLKIYPERRHWLVVPNVLFEVGAFMVAALGGVSIGLSILGGTGVSLAVQQWAVLFFRVVVPLQIVAAICEGLLLHQIHFVRKHPWPYGIP